LLDCYSRNAIASALDLVLDIGVGSGLNLPLYSPAVVADAVAPVSPLRGSAKHVPIADAASDTIVMTWTLCSIPNPIAALMDMRRVLRSGGQLLFVEHGRSPEIRIARWQHRLTPYWKPISGGCHLDHKMDDLIRAAGFKIITVETGYITGAKPWTFMYQGSATN
jgi:SAM-dependent methyltransferase